MENQQEREFTAEELAAQKEQMLQFYTESLPYIQAQSNYEEALLKLDEIRFKRASIQMQYAMMMQGPEEPEDENEDLLSPKEPEVPKRRKLKRESNGNS